MSQVSLRKETNLYDDLAIKAVNDKVVSQYAVSTTASSTVAKTATVDGNFELFKNARVSVFFQNANTATSPTLNIAGTGAKPIWAYGGPLSASGNTFNWVANSTIEFVYDGEHWLVADSGAVGLISKYDEKLDQEVVFNKLTDNGSIQGIFMQNGQMYINMDYLQTGTLKLGGANNGNGLMVVYDASGNEIGRWDKDGLSATGTLQISGSSNAMKAILALNEKKVVDDSSGITTTGSTLSFAKLFCEHLTAKTVSDNKTAAVWYRAPYLTTSGANGINDTSWAKGDRKIVHIYTASSPDDDNAAPTAYQAFEAATIWGTGTGYPGVGLKIVDKINNTSTIYGQILRTSIHLGTSNTNASATISTTYANDAQLKIDSTGIKFNSQNGGISAIGGNIIATDGGYIRAYASGIEIRCGGSDNSCPKIQAYTTGTFYLYVTSNVYLRHSGTSWYIASSSATGAIAVQGSSSKRYKHDITDKISEELDAHKLYDLKMKQFVFNDDHPLQYADMKNKTLPGFIAEDIAELYPAATIYNGDGEIESWDERRIIPGMLALIQEQKKQLDEQAEKIAKLENQTSFIHIS